MHFKLRDYQQDLLEQYNRELTTSRRVLLQLSTGAGKTVCFAFIIKEALAKGWRCLVLAHRVELILQAVDKVEAITDEPVGIIKAGYRPDYDRFIQVASVQSMTRRLSHFKPFDLIVVDEAHHSTSKTYQTILNSYPKAKILGVTATPTRLDGKGFRGTFDQLLKGITTKELIENGALSKYKYYATEKPMSLLNVRKEKGDYKATDIERANPIQLLAADIVKAHQDYALDKQTLVFCTSVEYSQVIAAHFNAVGINTAHLDGTSPIQIRSATMEAFKVGSIKVLCNCNLFDEGLDLNGIEAVILARPTAALSRFLQSVGRSLRPSEDKPNAVIIDLAGNYERHGFPCDDRDWTLDGVKTKPRIKTKLSRNPDTGLVEEVEIDLSSNLNLTELHPSGRKFSQENLGPWLEVVDNIYVKMKSNSFKPSWSSFELMDSEAKPPLLAWQYLGHLLGYHHGWSKYKVDEWIPIADRTTVRSKSQSLSSFQSQSRLPILKNVIK